MKITKKVSDLLNEQFYNELYAAHIYFAMSAALRHSPYQGNIRVLNRKGCGI